MKFNHGAVIKNLFSIWIAEYFQNFTAYNNLSWRDSTQRKSFPWKYPQILLMKLLIHKTVT